MEVGTANNTFNVFNIGRLLSRLQKKQKAALQVQTSRHVNKPCCDNSAGFANSLIISAAALQRVVTFTCCDLRY